MDGPETPLGTSTPAPAPQSAPDVSAPPPAQPSAPTQTAPPSAGPAQTVTSAPGLPYTPGQGAPQQPMSVRDALRGYGLDLTSQFQDDHQALQHLAGLYRQTREQADLARYGQQYLRHASDFQQWQQQRQQAAAQQQQAEQSWWKAPEYDPSWSQKLYKDPASGELKAVPGADPDLPRKYMAWIDHQRQFMDRFAQDPIAAIRPGVEQLALQVAQQVVQQQLGGYQERQVADGFVQQNSPWLHERDPQGNLVPGPNGKPALSPLGQRFAAYVGEAEQMGLRGVEQQRRYAMGLVQRDYLSALYSQQGQQQAAQPAPQQQAQADPAEQARQRFLQAQQQQRQSGQQAPPGANTNGAAPAGPGQRGLQELLMREMAANGYQPGQRLITGPEGG